MSELFETGLFQVNPIVKLPEGWHFNQLREIVPESRRVTYGIVQPGIHDPQGVLLIRGQDYIKGWAEPDAFFRVAKPLHEVFKRSLTLPGDLLICIVGATTGATNIVPSWIHEANITQTTARVACDSKKADSHFVLFALASELGQIQVRKYIKGSAQPGLNLADVECFVVPAPPLPEQKKIARILTTVDNLIEKTESLIAKYQAIKQGMMHDLFTRGIDAHGHLRPPQTEAPDLYKQSELGWIPKEWEARKLGDAANLQVGYAFKSSWFRDEGTFRLLRGDNVGFGTPDWSDAKFLSSTMARQFSEYTLHPGDVVIGMDRTFTKSGVKITQLQAEDCPALLVQRVGRFVPNRIESEFLRAFLGYGHYHAALALQQKGMDIPHLSQSEILKPLIPVPLTYEQNGIAARLVSIDATIAIEFGHLRKLTRTKTGLMQDLLTGKIRVKVDESEKDASVSS